MIKTGMIVILKSDTSSIYYIIFMTSTVELQYSIIIAFSTATLKDLSVKFILMVLRPLSQVGIVSTILDNKY